MYLILVSRIRWGTASKQTKHFTCISHTLSCNSFHIYKHTNTYTLSNLHVHLSTLHIKIRNAYVIPVFQIKILEHRIQVNRLPFGNKVSTMTLGIASSLVYMIKLRFFPFIVFNYCIFLKSKNRCICLDKSGAILFRRVKVEKYCNVEFFKKTDLRSS